MVNTRDNQYRLILGEHVGLGYMYMSETVCTEDVNAKAVKKHKTIYYNAYSYLMAPWKK